MAKNLIENPAILPEADGLSIRFHSDFSNKKYQLFEIPDQALLDQILKGEETPTIKNYTGHKAMAALTTSKETFKIKKAENTNKLFILEVNQGAKGAEILTQTSLQIELFRAMTKTYQVIQSLQGEMVSRQRLVPRCQISEEEFEKVVKIDNFKKYLRIFQKGEEFCIMEEEALFGVLDDLLVLINAKFSNQIEVNLGQILEANDGIINSRYGPEEIEFGLKHITTEGKLDRDLIQKAVAIQLLRQKSDGFRLKEFVSALKTAYELAIPLGLESTKVFNPKNNLYEGYDFDLECLIGQAIIIPSKHQRVHERSNEDDIILALNPFYSKETITDDPENLEKRLEKLFGIKDKWTFKEIQAFMVDFCDPEIRAKFDVWLAKNTRQVKEPNPFDAKVNQ